MENFKYRLRESISENDVNSDVNSKINLISSEKMLPTGEINKILNINDRFNEERRNSNTYRLIGTIQPLFSNVLMNVTGVNSLADFSTSKFRDNTFPLNGISVLDLEDLTFEEAIKEKLKEKNGWFGFEDPNLEAEKLCEFFDIEPSRDKFNYISSGETNNWFASIMYPSESASTIGDITFDGLLVVDVETVLVGGRTMVAFGTPVKHGLNPGERVKLSNISTILDGTYEIFRLGLDNGSLSDNYFCVNINPTLIPTLPSNVRLKRLVGDEESKYYFRKYKKLININNISIDSSDYEFYRLGFAQSSFEDSLFQLAFTEDLTIENLTDNLGRPLSELYFTLIKNTNYIGQSFFSNVQSGIKMDFVSGIEDNINIPDINRIHNGGSTPFQSHIPLETNILETDEVIYGDVVEYNRFELREKVLGEVNHRFNTINRENGGTITVDGNPFNMGVRQEGYVYQPFYKLQIKDFSGYIEQGDSSTIGIPSYAENLGDGRFIWRDLLDIGFNDVQENSLNYPFLNNAHYLHLNICHRINRQDPFGNYNLYYNQFPRDPFGDRKDERFEINSGNDEC